MCETDVFRISKKIERIVSGDKSEEEAASLLKALKNMPITLEVLQKTRIGMTVNALRKKSDKKDIQSEAKNLIKIWKKLLDSNGKTDEKAKSDRVGLPRNDSFASNISDSMDAADVVMSAHSDSANSVGTSKSKNASVRQPTNVSGDDVRTKSRELLVSSLQAGDIPEGSMDSDSLAARLEQCIFDHFKSTNDKYKSTIRSRIFNLRDKRNPELRENVLLGIVTPERLAFMTTEEMASQEMKQLRSKLTKDAINEHQIATDAGTPTDMFKCGRCKQNNCTYTQAQTRSADEPMTTFVFCRECGNRWKFC